MADSHECSVSEIEKEADRLIDMNVIKDKSICTILAANTNSNYIVVISYTDY